MSEFITTRGLRQGTLVKALIGIIQAGRELVEIYLYSVKGFPSFAIDTNFDIKNNNAFGVTVGGQGFDVAANTSFDTGTAVTIAANNWRGATLSITSEGFSKLTWASEDSASESKAIESLPNPTDETVVGFVTVKTATDEPWTAGTDALQGGTGGEPSSDTNYYNYNPFPRVGSGNYIVTTNGSDTVYLS